MAARSAIVFVSFLLSAAAGRAETLEGALAYAYVGNPMLNAGRASLRSVDESVAIAQSGYRPTVNLTAVNALTYAESRSQRVTSRVTAVTVGGGLNVNQTLFDGFATYNATRRAESGVFAAREDLRMTEGVTLFNAAQAYMDVLRGTAVVELQRNFVDVLQEQLRQTRDRFRSGEVTRTDVSQSEARLAGARYQVKSAEATLRANVSVYRQVIGVEPRQLAPGRPIDNHVPADLEAAVEIGLRENPRIIADLHALDMSEAQVKVLEAALYPRVNASGSVQRSKDFYLSPGSGGEGLVATVTGSLTIPVYQGGSEYAQIRAAKETATQARAVIEQDRDSVRAGIVRAWGVLEAAKAQVVTFQAQVRANEIALASVREEASVGQRTTLDVLNAQQELLTARVNLIAAQRDRVIGSFDVVQAIGRLTVRVLAVPAPRYDAKIHYDQVKSLWSGLRTPDGR